MATLVAAANAAPKTWDGGGGDGNWTTGSNWDLDAAPVATDSLLFDGAVNLTTNNDFAASTQFNGITFNPTADAFVLGGNTVNLGGDLTDNNTTLTESINLGLALIQSNTNATVATGGNLTIGGVIAGTGASLTKLGAGTLLLTGANTYSGGTTITQGTLQIGAPAAGTSYLGSGLVTLNGGTLLLSANGAPFALANAVNVTAASTVGVNAILNQSSNQLNGRITGGATLNLAIQSGATFGFGGDLSQYSGTVATDSSAGSIRFNGSTGSSLATFDLGASAVSLTIRSTTTTTVNVGALKSGANATLTNSATVPVNWVIGGNNLSTAFSGNITGTSSATTATQTTVNKVGTGTLTLDSSNAISLTGTTNANRGTLLLDFANMATPTNLLSAGSTLGLGGGTFSIKGNSVGTTEQTFAGTNVNGGASAIVLNPTTGTATNLHLTGITRVSGGTVNYTPIAGGTVDTTTANPLLAGGQQTILGGYATVSRNTWAVSGTGATAGAISGLADVSYANTSTVALSAAAAKDVDVAALGTNTTGALTINSLRFNDAAGGAVTLSGALTVATGGILVTSNVGVNPITISGGSLTNGTNTGADLIVIQNNTAAPLTISSPITGTSKGFTKSGAGTLIVTGANTLTGSGVYVNEGTLQIGDGTAATTLGGSSNSLNLTGGTLFLNVLSGGTFTTGNINISATSGLRLGAGNETVAGAYASVATQGPATLNLSSAGGQLTHSGTESGFTGTIAFTGATAFTYRMNNTGNANVGSTTALYDLGTNGGNQLNNRNGSGLTYNLGGLTGGSGTILKGAGTNSTSVISTYSIGALNTDTTFLGSIQDGSAVNTTTSAPAITNINKVGTGTLTFSGSGSYTGTTTVTGGRLVAGLNGALGSGNVSVLAASISLTIGTGVTNAIADTATLSLAGGGFANVADLGYLRLDGNETVGALTLAGVSFGPGIYGASTAPGVLNFGLTNPDEFFSGSGLLTVVPEPGSWAMMLLGGMGLLGSGRRRRRVTS